MSSDMFSEVSLRVRGVTKDYLIYERPEDRLKQMFRRKHRYYTAFPALKGVDLEIYRGETVGVVGRNGSGKTTLLEIIAGTLRPSAGTVEVSGRVAALLGLGAGFNPEFTGRDNVALNAAVLGLGPGALAAVFDRIAAFADIGPFLDRPVKTYSSGMFARLAFAVAIHVDPDILIVDETLSVGDEAFQRKCFRRIEELKADGCTILFVTHSAETVIDLCDRAVLLDRGERLLMGSPRTVIAQYQRLIHAPVAKAAAIREGIRAMDGQAAALALARVHEAPAHDAPAHDAPSRPVSESGGNTDDAPAQAEASLPGEEEDDAFLVDDFQSENVVEFPAAGALIEDVHVETPGGRRVNHLVAGHDYDLVYQVTFAGAVERVRFGMQIRTSTGLVVATQNSQTETEEGLSIPEAGMVREVRFPVRVSLVPGVYFMNAGVVTTDADGNNRYLHRLVDVLAVRVLTPPRQTASGVILIEGSRPVRLRRFPPGEPPTGSGTDERLSPTHD
ncbi:ABC transporter ATP-binding protein [Pararhodospirillum oryzae]|uniref:ABC transporter n=1 Tax=Pararhodospirillum oryzae TaxID=478448 RepID=A0A512H9H7_9PROT|nr:ABC transporter ATP-binding protein [Pararhodospirillum oryzae]GEO82078.1 ABC transporter [Pararhodospirillum oryzae]